MTSGYTDCACRDCFEIAISSDDKKPALCNLCQEAECSANGDEECSVPPEEDIDAVT
jgi:hypothetical protein